MSYRRASGKLFPAWKREPAKGIALVIVLAFVVLLTGVVIAYLVRTTTDRQLAVDTFGDAAADLLARGALNVVVGDFKQEIVNGSNPITTGGTPATYYSPNPNINVVPKRNVSGIPNLIRISIRSDNPGSPAIGSRASAVNSTDDKSVNGRSVSRSRWNEHCLLPMDDPANADNDPKPVASFSPTPDWVFVTAQGPTPGPVPAEVIGRYAYAVYDEGGLLDMNIAGGPSPTPAGSPVGRKGIVTFADLRALPYKTSNASFTGVGQVVNWRNNATLQATPSGFPSWSVALANTVGFVSSYLSTNQSFTSPASTVYNNRTDQIFVSRGELLNFNRFQGSAGFDSNSLGCVGTFSRERNIPTFWLRSAPNASANPLNERFLIANLDYVVPNPPSSSTATILQKFALQWVAAPSRWRYAFADIPPPGPSNNTFFQLLRYARSSNSSTPAIMETLSLGAALIDQYDADTSTTQIEYIDGTGATLIAYGMEVADSSRPTGGATPAPTPPSGPPVYKMLPIPTISWDKPFRNVGEFGYAYSPSSPNASKTIDFFTNNSANFDPRILDLFAFNVSSQRAGQVNLNTQNSAVVAAILKLAWTSTTSGSGLSTSAADSAAAAIITETRTNPALGKQDIARICAVPGVGSAVGGSEEAQETIARALAETCTTRAWGLLIDVISQSGRCKPNASNLSEFVVEGEKRYWLHVAIDRFYGDTIDQQLEAVYE